MYDWFFHPPHIDHFLALCLSQPSCQTGLTGSSQLNWPIHNREGETSKKQLSMVTKEEISIHKRAYLVTPSQGTQGVAPGACQNSHSGKRHHNAIKSATNDTNPLPRAQPVPKAGLLNDIK